MLYKTRVMEISVELVNVNKTILCSLYYMFRYTFRSYMNFHLIHYSKNASFTINTVINFDIFS